MYKRYWPYFISYYIFTCLLYNIIISVMLFFVFFLLGKYGRVIDVRGWDNETSHSVANVTWTSGSTNVYRVGHKGKMDLKYMEASAGGSYYRDHLPLLGMFQLT